MGRRRGRAWRWRDRAQRFSHLRWCGRRWWWRRRSFGERAWRGWWRRAWRCLRYWRFGTRRRFQRGRRRRGGHRHGTRRRRWHRSWRRRRGGGRHRNRRAWFHGTLEHNINPLLGDFQRALARGTRVDFQKNQNGKEQMRQQRGQNRPPAQAWPAQAAPANRAPSQSFGRAGVGQFWFGAAHGGLR